MNKKVFNDGTVAIWHDPIIRVPEENDVKDVKKLIVMVDEILAEQQHRKENYLLTTNKEQ